MDLLLIFGIPLVAVFFASRHEDALTQAQNLLRPLPNSHPALRIAAASAAFAGRADVAHQWAKRLLQIDPSFSISRLCKYLGPYQRPEFAEKYADGLRRAGVPEVSSNTARPRRHLPMIRGHLFRNRRHLALHEIDHQNGYAVPAASPFSQPSCPSIFSATRSAFAAMVSDGFIPALDGKNEASTT
jgi:hypothetical protein